MNRSSDDPVDLLKVVRWRLPMIALITLGVVVVVTAYVQTLPTLYEAQAIVSIVPRPTASFFPGADYISLAAPKYVAYATAPGTLEGVARPLGVEASSLKDAVNAAVETGTSNITVGVTLSSPREAASAANAVAEAIVAFSATDRVLSAQIVAPAVIPTAPSSPLRKLDELAGLVVGALVAIVIAYVLERRNPRIRTREDLRALGDLRIIGSLPTGNGFRPGAEEDASVQDPIRALRLNVEHAVQALPGRLLVVTSAARGEGKSTVSLVLSAALARVGQRILLVDGDLYRAGISNSVNHTRDGGLLALLRGSRRSLASHVKRGSSRGVSILPTTTDRGAGDLVVQRFPDVIREVESCGFDYVIVDAPPLLEADVGQTMALFANGVLLVVSAGTRKEQVVEALRTLSTSQTPLIGVIGNRMTPPWRRAASRFGPQRFGYRGRPRARSS